VNSRYKVYIVDEAHMVTTQGFNALLKLVEEPPEFLVFVFATTEPDKVLPTIRSRTHHYPFRLVPPTTLRALLEKTCNRRGVAPSSRPSSHRCGARRRGIVRDSRVHPRPAAGRGRRRGRHHRAPSAPARRTDDALLDETDRTRSPPRTAPASSAPSTAWSRPARPAARRHRPAHRLREPHRPRPVPKNPRRGNGLLDAARPADR
jgi:hypothetical protein